MKNKNKAKLIVLGIIAVFAVVAMSFAPDGGGEGSASTYYYYPTVQDTITNTEADTLSVSEKFLSSYSYGYHILLTNLSGTTSVTAVLQEAMTKTGNTDWKTIGTFSDTSGVSRLVGSYTYGLRHRLILTGSGTQSTKYNVYGMYKKQ